MQSAINKISKLLETEQKVLANLIEQEIQFQKIELQKGSELMNLADKAINEYYSKETDDLDW